MRPHRGILILVFGILGLVICGPLGIAAWIMGNNDMKLIDAGQMDPAGRGLTEAGRIIGIVGTVLFILAAIMVVLLLALGGFASILHRT